MSLPMLKEEFPPNYLEVALKFISASVPVFIPVSEHSVQHVTREDILRWKANPKTLPPVVQGKHQPPAKRIRTTKYTNLNPPAHVPLATTPSYVPRRTATIVRPEDRKENSHQGRFPEGGKVSPEAAHCEAASLRQTGQHHTQLILNITAHLTQNGARLAGTGSQVLLLSEELNE